MFVILKKKKMLKLKKYPRYSQTYLCLRRNNLILCVTMLLYEIHGVSNKIIKLYFIQKCTCSMHPKTIKKKK